MKLTWRETFRAFIDLAAPGSLSLIRYAANAFRRKLDMVNGTLSYVRQSLLPVVATAVSCGVFQTPRTNAMDLDASYFQTDRVTYTLTTTSPQATIIVNYRNHHPYTVYFRVCGHKNTGDDPPAIGTKPVSEIVSAATGEDTDLGLEWACLYAPRRPVAPGGVLVDSVPIHRATAGGATSGSYRVVYNLYDRPSTSERDEEGLISLMERRTSTFHINISRTDS